MQSSDVKLEEGSLLARSGEALALPLQEELHSSVEVRGLTTLEAEARLSRFGRNENSDDEAFLRNSYAKFTFILEIMLSMASALSFVNYFVLNDSLALDQVKDYQRVVLGMVLLLMALSSFIFRKRQEQKVLELSRSMRRISPTLTNVYRDGELQALDSTNIVPGDVILVQSGECVTADVRVIENFGLVICKKDISGERFAQEIKSHVFGVEDDADICFSGSHVESGSGVCVVVATGTKTYLSTISNQTHLQEPRNLEVPGAVPIRMEVEKLVKSVSMLSFALGVPLSIVAWHDGFATQTCISLFIAVVMANIPMSLLPQISVSFSILAKRLQTKSIFVSRLDIIDTFASIDVLCIDKTGTLTEPKLELCSLFHDESLMCVSESILIPNGECESKKITLFMEFACLTTQAEKEVDENDAASTSGSQDTEDNISIFGMRTNEIENSIIRFIDANCPDAFSVRKFFEHVYTIPFRSSVRYMMKVYIAKPEEVIPDDLKNGRKFFAHELCKEEGGNVLAVLKGSPDTVLKLCSHVLIGGLRVPLDIVRCNLIKHTNRECAQRGERVIAIAQKTFFAAENSKYNKFRGSQAMTLLTAPTFTFIGLMTFTEKIRTSAISTLKGLKRAGIKTYLITGDSSLNSQIIARRSGLLSRPTRKELVEKGISPGSNYGGAAIVTGSEVKDYTPREWDELLANDEIVFSEMLPHLKEKVLMELKRNMKVVAMLGDGVNDAPALKNAHVSIAMGSGTAVAKEASHIILLDDDIKGVFTGIEEGRKLVWNLKKSVEYLLTSNIPEMIPVIVVCAFSYPRALDTVSMLSFEIFINVFPSISLSHEPPEKTMMRGRPTDNQNFITLSSISFAYFIGLVQSCAAYYAFLNVFEFHGFLPQDLHGAGPHIRDSWSSLNSERRLFFTKLCLTQGVYINDDGTCDNDKFEDLRILCLNQAQAAYFIILVVGQVGNCLSMRTRHRTLLSPKRLMTNSRLLLWLFVGLLLSIMIVTIPMLNTCFNFSQPPVEPVSRSLWVFPAVLFFGEMRKTIGRRQPPDI